MTQAQIKSLADTVFSLKLLTVKMFDKTLYDIVKGLNVYKSNQYKYRFKVLDSESIDVKMCVKVPLSGVIMTYV